MAWDLRFPDGGAGWDGADPPLPRGVHAVVALGAEAEPKSRPRPLPRARLPRGWSVLDGGAASLAAGLPLHELPAEADAMAEALAAWTLARLEDPRAVLPDLAAG